MNENNTRIALNVLKRMLSKERFGYFLSPFQQDRLGSQIGLVTEDNHFLVINECGFYYNKSHGLSFALLTDKTNEEHYETNMLMARIGKVLCDTLDKNYCEGPL